MLLKRKEFLASPDLRVWRIGNPGPDNLYHLDDENSPSTTKAFLIPESVYGLSKNGMHGDCFSTCGKYFAFWCKSTDNETDLKVEITILELDLVHSNVKMHSRNRLSDHQRTQSK